MYERRRSKVSFTLRPLELCAHAEAIFSNTSAISWLRPGLERRVFSADNGR